MKINVTHVAKLANLPLSEKEIKQFDVQLEETLNYIAHLNEIDTENIQPTSQVTGLENIVAEDIPIESLTQEQALANAKNQHNGLFKVKGIFTDE
ncbi:MAG TPA: Asp-tRNA(Asn)/Glu-tRNA(Gln) amidotransferase subunit GatC [Patescibacteria group bacterium]|nr:Asp-tRNA(Asn)/Glu-tRNA(Gln) amidotransferase subunit GatC [Patescibacteria group bacterium]